MNYKIFREAGGGRKGGGEEEKEREERKEREGRKEGGKGGIPKDDVLTTFKVGRGELEGAVVSKRARGGERGDKGRKEKGEKERREREGIER